MKDETPAERTRRILTTVPRLFAVSIDGIWRMASGVYIEPLKEPFKVKCIFNGREIIVINAKRYVDYQGYSEKDVECGIIKKNIQTLPKPSVRIEPQPLPPRRGRIMPTFYRANNNWGDIVPPAEYVPAAWYDPNQTEAPPEATNARIVGVPTPNRVVAVQEAPTYPEPAPPTQP